MARASVADRLRHILDEIELLRSFTVTTDAGGYQADRMLRRAVERSLEIISEASRHVPDTLRAKHPEIPWRSIADIGNVLRHGYDQIADRRIWAVVERELASHAELQAIVADYLQLAQASKSGRAENRVQEISEITRGLKALAKELNVPVIALSQLSRAVEQRDDKRPQLSDLRESGSIEQDADMVWFVFREDYYVAAKEPKRPEEGDDAKTHEAHAAWAAEMERVYGTAELIVAKQRHGSTGKVRMRFESRITRFSDLADESMRHESYE